VARIVVIQLDTETRELDGFSLRLLMDEWGKAGHEVVVAFGIGNLPDADLAILHVNLSLVPDSYAEAARRYPKAVNGAALDIRKRTVSRFLVRPGDGWNGPVIVKTDLNCNGMPEWVARFRVLSRQGLHNEPQPPIPGYTIYDRPDEVPATTWSDPALVVERFLPERDDHGFYLRTWIFFGKQECCRRFLSRKTVIKGADYIAFTPAEVPEILRAERERLGIDYGKFDFVIHEGQPVLFDVNKTPGIPPAQKPRLRSAYAGLAPGIATYLD
jgi:hypothetical protein